MVICLERAADLHKAQLMPLPLTVSCSSKIQIGFTFLVPAHPGNPGKRAVKRVCVCVCLGKRIVFFLLLEAFCGLKYAENAIAGGAGDAPPDPVVGWGVDTPPHLAPLIVVPL